MIRQWNGGWLCYYVGSKPWTRKGTSGILGVIHMSSTVVQHKLSQKMSVLQHLTMRGCYFPFVLVLGVHVRCKSHSSPRWLHHWQGSKILFFNQHFPSFAHSYSTCRVQIQPRQHSHMPWLHRREEGVQKWLPRQPENARSRSCTTHI